MARSTGPVAAPCSKIGRALLSFHYAPTLLALHASMYRGRSVCAHEWPRPDVTCTLRIVGSGLTTCRWVRSPQSEGTSCCVGL